METMENLLRTYKKDRSILSAIKWGKKTCLLQTTEKKSSVHVVTLNIHAIVTTLLSSKMFSAHDRTQNSLSQHL